MLGRGVKRHSVVMASTVWLQWWCDTDVIVRCLQGLFTIGGKITWVPTAADS